MGVGVNFRRRSVAGSRKSTRGEAREKGIFFTCNVVMQDFLLKTKLRELREYMY